MVFCKRWGGSSVLLQQQIAKRGHARVIDAGEAKLNTVTMEPKITVDAVRWLKDKSNWLEVDFSPSIAVRGDAASRVWAAVKWKSQASDAEGDTEIDVVPGASESPRRTLRMPVPANAIGEPS
ncbi:MAG TPA: hypothetical protein VK137_11155, partial [Planctomycetaceae bacterium]|nr:hypothetical protein [Planctomycetaceae bacterium]